MDVNQVVVVFGHGLMNVTEVDAKKSVFACVSHGPKKTNGHWFRFDQARELTRDEAKEALILERKEAAARRVSCNNPDCWCVAWFST
jgi:hypothetical protein